MDFCNVRKLQSLLRSLEDTIKQKTGLTLNESYCLCAISHGLHDLTNLANELNVSPSRLTRILDGMEHDGLILRSLSKNDRRRMVIALTDRGNHLGNLVKHIEVPVPEPLKIALEYFSTLQKEE